MQPIDIDYGIESVIHILNGLYPSDYIKYRDSVWLDIQKDLAADICLDVCEGHIDITSCVFVNNTLDVDYTCSQSEIELINGELHYEEERRREYFDC